MAKISAKDVQALRAQTGVGMMEVKNALVEADGDMEKATLILREKGLAAAQKKAGRIAAEGVITTATDANAGIVVEVNAETDFVAQNKEFLAFVDAIAQTILKENPADLNALKAMTLDGSNETVEAALQDKILVIGENMNIRRFARTEGNVASYIHGNGRIGVLVSVETEDYAKVEDAVKDVTMQIAAANPKYLSKDEVPEDEVAAEKKFLTDQVVNEGKPENIAEKIVAGRIGKFFEQIVLLEQPFVKDGNLTVAEYLEQAGKEAGVSIRIKEFYRYEVGEGLEKREENFADEVAGMMG